VSKHSEKNLSKVETEKENAENFEEKDKVIPQAKIKEKKNLNKMINCKEKKKNDWIFVLRDITLL
jgi:hypothetical protein